MNNPFQIFNLNILFKKYLVLDINSDKISDKNYFLTKLSFSSFSITIL